LTSQGSLTTLWFQLYRGAEVFFKLDGHGRERRSLESRIQTKITVLGIVLVEGQGIPLSIILIGAALLLFIGQTDSSAAAEWFLMSRHGECVEIQSLKRKVPELGEVRDPSMVSSSCAIKGIR